MSSLVAAGVPATVRGQVARSLLPPCSDRPPLPQRAHSLGEKLITLFTFSSFLLLQRMAQISVFYETFLGVSHGIFPCPSHSFPPRGPPLQRPGTPRWQQESLVHPLLPLCRLAWPSRGLRGPLHTVRAFANFTLFLMHQGSWIFKKYYRRSFGKEWNHFDLF